MHGMGKFIPKTCQLTRKMFTCSPNIFSRVIYHVVKVTYKTPLLSNVDLLAARHYKMSRVSVQNITAILVRLFQLVGNMWNTHDVLGVSQKRLHVDHTPLRSSPSNSAIDLLQANKADDNTINNFVKCKLFPQATLATNAAQCCTLPEKQTG